MEFQNNIVKHHLKKVFFISGTACGGKTTIAKRLGEKYGFYLYDMDQAYPRHRAIAAGQFQPDMCYHLTDHHEQWTRPIEEQARWSMNSLKEQSEMVLIDLMKLSEHQTVVADVLYSPFLSLNIIDYNKLVFLTADKSFIRKQYFNRPEKRDFYDFVKLQEQAELYFENIFKSLELVNEREQKLMKDSGFKIIERTENSTIENTLSKIEKHFGLRK